MANRTSWKWALLCLLTIMSLAACQSGKQEGISVTQLQPVDSDEAQIYAALQNIQNYISAGEWDKWLALYSDDAILTKGSAQVSKEEMRAAVDGITYVITSMTVLEKNIGASEAIVRTSMVGNGKKQLESYRFNKIDGKWLIMEETNP